MDFPQMGNGPNRKPIVDALRNTAQSASNMVAENISVPMDAIAWALRKAGVPVEKPMFGSDWMKEKGVTPQVEQGASKVIGDTIGMLSPMGFTKQGAQALIQGAGKLKNLPVGMSIKDVSGAGGQAANVATDYRMRHTAPDPEFGAPLFDLTGGGEFYPSNVYSANAAQLYRSGNPKADMEAFKVAHQVKGNPDAEVVMYRAVPKGIKDINQGDWVTLSKNYAVDHGEHALKNNYDILEKRVKARDLWTNADSIQEFGYHPQVK